jgi:hypothetical protein
MELLEGILYHDPQQDEPIKAASELFHLGEMIRPPK